MVEKPSEPTRLVCANCATEADEHAGGWRAYLHIEDEMQVFCPECAEREFESGETVGADGLRTSPPRPFSLHHDHATPRYQRNTRTAWLSQNGLPSWLPGQ